MIRVYAKRCPFSSYAQLHRAAYELLYFVLLRDFPFAEEDLVLCKTEAGKPYFRDVPICFSISHTEGLVVVAVGNTQLGVDAEKADRILKKGIGARFLHKEEADISDWVMYESVGKMQGCGIPYDPSEIHDAYFCKIYRDVAGYVVCCAGYDNMFPEHIELI